MHSPYLSSFILLKKKASCILTVIFFLFVFHRAEAQTHKIDSLKNELAHASGQQQLKLIFELCHEKNSMPADSLLKYIGMAASLNAKSPDKRAGLMIEYYRATYIQQSDVIDTAMEICLRNLSLIGNDPSLADIAIKFKSVVGVLQIRKSRFKEAMGTFFDLLQQAEKNKDTLNEMVAENGIGWANMELENYREAITWFQKAVQLTEGQLNFFKLYPVSNLAATYNSIHKNDSALSYIDKAIRYAGESEDLKALANACAIKSDILIDLGKPSAAEEMLVKALQIRKQVGDPYYIVSDLYQLGVFYSKTHQCEKGKAICFEGIELARKNNLPSKITILYQALAENYKSCLDYAGYSAILEKLISLKDSVHEKNSADALAEIQTKYELEKKEKIITQQKYDLVKRNYLFYGSLAVFLMIGIIAYQFFSQYRQKQKTISMLAVTKAREKERSRIASELHDDIGSALGSISFYSEAAKNNLARNNTDNIGEVIERIGDTSREMMDNIGDIVWAVNPKNDSGQEIILRMQSFARPLCEAKNIMLHFEASHEVKNMLLTMEQRKNIFLVFKESLHNALKYADCHSIFISFTRTNGQVQLSIRDDGKGFNSMERNAYNGNGLKNMQSRAEEINAEFTCASEMGKGTQVMLQFLPTD